VKKVLPVKALTAADFAIYGEVMNENTTDPDQIPNVAGEGDTSTDAPDTTSGGSPDTSSDRPPATEQPDGTPTENPSGG
jgi:hypothetical protein